MSLWVFGLSAVAALLAAPARDDDLNSLRRARYESSAVFAIISLPISLTLLVAAWADVSTVVGSLAAVGAAVAGLALANVVGRRLPSLRLPRWWPSEPIVRLDSLLVRRGFVFWMIVGTAGLLTALLLLIAVASS